jgi:hypothetical protein
LKVVKERPEATLIQVDLAEILADAVKLAARLMHQEEFGAKTALALMVLGVMKCRFVGIQESQVISIVTATMNLAAQHDEVQERDLMVQRVAREEAVDLEKPGDA